jgi:lambda family phage portal protein
MGFLDIFKRSQQARRKSPTGGQRIFQAANTGRLESSWTGTPSTIDSWIYQHWLTLVARSREQAENGDHMRKFVQLVRDNVAGPVGFTLQAQVRDPNGRQDSLASNAIEDAWWKFRRKGLFDVSGQLSGADVDRLAATTAATDGEFIAIKRYGADLNEYGFALQLVDPMLLDPKQYAELDNGNTIRHGIEFNANGKPIAYHFRKYDERQVGYISTFGSNSFDRVPAENVIHVFMPEKVGQKRGLPWARTALWRMRMLHGFEDAAITNARVGAAKMGFFKDPDADNDGEDALPMDAEAGVFENIGNRELVEWNPQFPDQSIDPFTKSILRSISSGLGVSYNNLASDLTSVNFSSIRQGALDEREVWKGLQEWLIEHWCMPVYNAWLERALLSGAITVAGRPLKVERLEKYRAVTFQGRRWAWIDPQAEMSANEKAIALRIKSRSEVIREMTTRDPVDVWDEVQREEEEMAARSVTVLPTAGAPTAAAQNNETP